MHFKEWTYKRIFFPSKGIAWVFSRQILHFVYELYWQEKNFKRVNSQQLERTENHRCFLKCFCRSLGTADCRMKPAPLWSPASEWHRNHLFLFRAIPALFLFPVLYWTLTQRSLILPNTFCTSEFFLFFLLNWKAVRNLVLDGPKRLFSSSWNQLKYLGVLQKVFHEIPTGGFQSMTQIKNPGSCFHFIPN